MKTLAESAKDLVARLEEAAGRTIKVWALLVPGRDKWLLFAEYKAFCAEEQTIHAFVTAAANRVRRVPDAAGPPLLYRISQVERMIQRAGTAVHRRYLEALNEPGVPLPMDSARFLSARMEAFEALDRTAVGDIAEPLTHLTHRLRARGHAFEDLGSRS